VPLVGVWVRGVASPHHPLVFAACLRFAYGAAMLDRAIQPDGAFLVLIFPPEGCSLPRCYEARFVGGAASSDGCTPPLELMPYTWQVGASPVAATHQYRLPDQPAVHNTATGVTSMHTATAL
jgi:hypothetical protein